MHACVRQHDLVLAWGPALFAFSEEREGLLLSTITRSEAPQRARTFLFPPLERETQVAYFLSSWEGRGAKRQI